MWFYLKWSAYLYPGYYFISLFAGAKLAKASAPVWVKVFISLLPMLSFTPYTALFLFFAFSS
ncbi:hypothetical protein [Thalassotalea sp. PLHSN55]|uniref:hypothetical protein n=1 Tax=Thalassotalea sp. PLHSN55 TaxID=3435888 RepID=UPI003F83174C